MSGRCRLCPGVGTLRLGEGVTVVWAPTEDTHRVVWRTPDGRRRQKRSRDHRDAVGLAQDIVDQLLTPPATQPAAVARRPPMSVPDLAAGFVAAASVERGWSADYLRKCERFIARQMTTWLDMPTASWEVADTLTLLDAVAGTLAAGGRQQLLSLLRQTAKHGMQRGLIDRDPTAGVEVTRPQRHRPTAEATDGGEVRYVEVDERPSTQQVERLAAAFTDDGHDPLPAQVSGYAGLRIGEVFALEREDVDLDAGTIAVVRRVDPRGHARDGTVMTPDGRRRRYWRTRYGHAALPKGGKTRVVMLPPHMADALANRPPGLLFPNRSGTYMRNETWWNRKPFGRARLWAGWPMAPDGSWVWTWHSLRHHAATWMLEQGVPIHDVSEMLGHSQVETTLRMYVHTEQGAAGRAARRLAGWQPPAA